MSAFSYAVPSGQVPDYYKCERCKAHGVKLWRKYQTMCPTLLCGPCAMADQKTAGELGDDGRREDDGVKTDQIGWYVPAVPDQEGVGYWGYTSVPNAGVSWWRALPLRVAVRS